MVLVPHSSCPDHYTTGNTGSFYCFQLFFKLDVGGIKKYLVEIDHIKTFAQKLVTQGLNDPAFQCTYLNSFVKTHEGVEIVEPENFPPASRNDWGTTGMAHRIGVTQHDKNQLFGRLEKPEIAYSFNNTLDTWMTENDMKSMMIMLGLDIDEMEGKQRTPFFKHG